MAVMEISVVPLGTRTPSISDYVSEAVKILEKEGLEYQLTAMGTIVEADLERLFDLALRECTKRFWIRGRLGWSPLSESTTAWTSR
jgi:uncharacterized protein (TIGR00106 family)